MKSKKEIEQRVKDIDNRIDQLMFEKNKGEFMSLNEQYRNMHERQGLWDERGVLVWVLND